MSFFGRCVCIPGQNIPPPPPYRGGGGVFSYLKNTWRSARSQTAVKPVVTRVLCRNPGMREGLSVFAVILPTVHRFFIAQAVHQPVRPRNVDAYWLQPRPKPKHNSSLTTASPLTSPPRLTLSPGCPSPPRKGRGYAGDEAHEWNGLPTPVLPNPGRGRPSVWRWGAAVSKAHEVEFPGWHAMTPVNAFAQAQRARGTEGGGSKGTNHRVRWTASIRVRSRCCSC